MLDGITVLDLSRDIAGPYACMLLGTMGARVIKIEPPGGSTERSDTRFFLWNRGKELVTLDLESQQGRDVVRRLAAMADVLVIDRVPEEAHFLGLAYDSLRASHPGLIYCAIPTYPEGSSLENTPGDAYTAAAFMGLMAGRSAGESPEMLYLPVAAYGSAFTSCFAISSALLVRELDGIGQKVEVSLQQGAMAMQTAGFTTGQAFHPRGSSFRQGIWVGIPVYRLFHASEGWFFLACGNNTFFNKLCIALELEGLADDERFRDAPWGIASENYDALADILEPIFLVKPAEYWVQFLTKNDIPCGTVQERDVFIHHPQIAVNEMMRTMDDPTLGMTLQPGVPVWMHGQPGVLPEPTALSGAHTESVLAELGYSEGEVSELREGGAWCSAKARDGRR